MGLSPRAYEPIGQVIDRQFSHAQTQLTRAKQQESIKHIRYALDHLKTVVMLENEACKGAKSVNSDFEVSQYHSNLV